MEVLEVGEQRSRKENRTLFLQGMRQSLPIALSAVVDGMVFGVLAIQAGCSIEEAMLFSLLVNAGSAQFAALGFITQGVVGWTMLFTIFLLNARHMLYGIALGPAFRKEPAWKLALMATQLTDESYAIKANYLATGKQPSAAYYYGASTTDYVFWNLATLLGALFGALISEPSSYGLDFAFLATFLGYLAILFVSRFYVIVAVVAAAAASLGYWVGGTTAAVVLGTLSAILMGVFSRERE